MTNVTSIRLVASNIQKLKIIDLELSLISLPPLLPPSSNSMQQATLELLHFLLFLSTASSHPPSLPPLSLSSLPPLEKVPPGFLALKGQKQTGSWQPPIPWALVTDGGRREDRTGEGKGGRGGGGPRKKRGKKKKAGKSAVWDIFKARTDNSTR